MQPLEHNLPSSSDADVEDLLEATEDTEDDRLRAARGTVGGVIAIPVAFVALVLLVGWAWPPVSLLVALTATVLSPATP